jgi:hypothetical protein
VPKPEVRIIRPPRRLGALEYLVHQLGDVGARNVEAGDSSQLCFRLLCGLGDHTPIVNLVSARLSSGCKSRPAFGVAQRCQYRKSGSVTLEVLLCGGRR